MKNQITETAIDMFLEVIPEEVMRSVKEFPQPNPTTATLAGEVGELTQVLLRIREGEHNDWRLVYNKAIQIATMACRISLEGDQTIGAIPTEEKRQTPITPEVFNELLYAAEGATRNSQRKFMGYPLEQITEYVREQNFARQKKT